MGYIYLALAIVLELCGTTCMKLSDGFDFLRLLLLFLCAVT